MNKPVLFIIQLARKETISGLLTTQIYSQGCLRFTSCPVYVLNFLTALFARGERTGAEDGGRGDVYHAKGARPHKRTTIEEGELHNPNNSWTHICGKGKKKKKVI